MKGWRYVFMDAAGDGTGTGGSAGGSGDSGQGAGAGGDQGGQSGAGSAGAAGTASGTGAGSAGEGGNALQAGAQAVTIPEKYQVKKEDGSLDIEASSLKLAEAYGHLAKRMGTGDAPPKSADDYQVTVPDALKDVWKPEGDPLLAEFKKDAHAKGLTQGQFDFVMAKYMDLAPKLVSGSQTLSAEDCVADLKTEWKTDEQYKAEVGKAYKAAVGYAGNDAEYIIKTYGNDPKVIRMLNRIGAEMGEDGAVSTGGSLPAGQSVDTLMQSDAYTNPKHADHARVSKIVSQHFEKQAAAQAKTGAALVM